MRLILIAVMLYAVHVFAGIARDFSKAKIANDSSIATDTRRIADAAERAHPSLTVPRLKFETGFPACQKWGVCR